MSTTQLFKNPRAKHNFQGRTCSITGVGSYVPGKILTNADLEKMVETSDEWITTRTGIKERRIAAKDEFTSDLAAKAAQRAMKMAGVTADQIDLIIVATITPDMPFPNTACLVQRKIGAQRAAAFDIEAACSGFIYALEIGQQFIMSRTYETVLVIGAEKLSSITDWTGPQHLRAVRRRRGRGDFAEPRRLARPAHGGDGRGRQQGGFAVHARRRQPLSGDEGYRGRAAAFPADGRQGDVQERRAGDVERRRGGVAPLRN